MKILLVHTNYDIYTGGVSRTNSWISRLKLAGYEVEGFSLAYSHDRPVLYFRELNVLWKFKDKKLIALYKKLAEKITEFDVLMLYNGANLHPDFAAKLDCIKVYSCFDDPESSEVLSKPVVGAFDIALVGNIAAVDAYKDWGVRRAYWWPIGFRLEDYNPSLDANGILLGHRNHDIALLCERLSSYRRNRVDKIQKAFPLGAYYGKGWSAGYLPESQRVPLLQNTKIGINIHNSTGPINFRTFYLPANGLLQICDNKSFLRKVFSEKEVVGYDTVDEAIDLIQFYLHNKQERIDIALAGWRRTIKDYNEVAVFEKAIKIISNNYPSLNSSTNNRVTKFNFTESTNTRSLFSNTILLIFNLYIKFKFIIKIIREIIFGNK